MKYFNFDRSIVNYKYIFPQTLHYQNISKWNQIKSHLWRMKKFNWNFYYLSRSCKSFQQSICSNLVSRTVPSPRDSYSAKFPFELAKKKRSWRIPARISLITSHIARGWMCRWTGFSNIVYKQGKAANTAMRVGGRVW